MSDNRLTSNYFNDKREYKYIVPYNLIHIKTHIYIRKYKILTLKHSILLYETETSQIWKLNKNSKNILHCRCLIPYSR